MGELLEFLKYGAIGVAVLLAGMSYKLLAREQEKSEIRPPMLNTIKFYFSFSLILSLFFGGVEVMTSLKKGPVKLAELDTLYKRVTKASADTTQEAKVQAIASHIWKIKESNQEYVKTLDSIKQSNNSLDLYKIVAGLSTEVDRYRGINLKYNKHDKTEVFRLLDQLFACLQQEYDAVEQGQEQILANQWIKFKSKWSKDDRNWIYHSDLGAIVTHYLRLQKNQSNTEQQ